jgi:hypothetical protein
MKPKTRFMKMFYKLPEKARTKLVYGYPDEPMTLQVIVMEIQHDTELGKRILRDLGFMTDLDELFDLSDRKQKEARP